MKLVAWLLALLLPSSAPAQGLNLSWNDCGAAGVQNLNFACNLSTGPAFVAVGSYLLPRGTGLPIGNDIVLDLVSAGSTLPAWWDFVNPGACRPTSLGMTFSLAATTTSSCQDFWRGQAVGRITAYQTIRSDPASAGSNRARLMASFGIGPFLDVTPESEMFSFNLRIDRAGTAVCTGCTVPVCLVFNSAYIHSDYPGSDALITTPLTRNWITWQGGGVDGGCPGATPTRNRTWGQVKSLYR